MITFIFVIIIVVLINIYIVIMKLIASPKPNNKTNTFIISIIIDP